MSDIEKPTWTKEDKDRILKQALEKYPIGTTVVSAYSGSTYTIEKHTHDWNDTEYLRLNAIGIYNKGKWAKIISYPAGYKPKSEIITEYQIY